MLQFMGSQRAGHGLATEHFYSFKRVGLLTTLECVQGLKWWWWWFRR